MGVSNSIRSILQQVRLPFLAVGFVSAATCALAQGVFYTPHQLPTSWDINIGAGAVMRPTFEGSDHYNVTPVPWVNIRWRDTVSLAEDGLSVYWHRDGLRVGSGLSYGGGRLDHEANGLTASGDNRLQGLGDVDSSVGAKAFISYQLGPVFLNTIATKYLGRDNNGFQINLAASAPLMLTDRLILRPHGRITWADDNYTETYFGVTPGQSARSMFPQFTAGSGLEDVNAGLSVIFLLKEHWFFGIDASATHYLNDAAHSPISIANTNAIVAAGAGYHF